MKHLGPLVLVAMATCALPYTAQAQGQVAYTATSVNVRAGPARDYPIVAVLPPGYPVAIQGCLPNYTWCDVVAGPSRGWVYAGNINYAYQNTYVPVLNYGAIIGIGVLVFVLDDYWGHHYHNQPWYGQRHRWINRPAAPAPRYSRPPPPRPGVIGPRPPQPRSVVPRPPSSPPGSVRPGPNVPPRQGMAPGDRPHPRQRPAPGVEPGRRSPQREGHGRGPDQQGR